MLVQRDSNPKEKEEKEEDEEPEQLTCLAIADSGDGGRTAKIEKYVHCFPPVNIASHSQCIHILNIFFFLTT